MSTREHLLAIVEPAPGGDAILDLARDTVARGGTVSVVIAVTERVQRSIRALVESEELAHGEAEARALDQLRAYCAERVGGNFKLDTYIGTPGTDVVRYVTVETTAIALPARLAGNRLVERLAAYTGMPVIVIPSLSAAA